ncbi:COQ9-domain-containing protein [Rhypophila decipiens]|uniref:Ubiquinone biosynthesis protein n=1 Tax=Rhypophila decipiens TaxID=261697 RepID=A0AAN7BCX7_9PEZI|nr:COQ9-domain-containing protein [Rhypophila decipiens]
MRPATTTLSRRAATAAITATRPSQAQLLSGAAIKTTTTAPKSRYITSLSRPRQMQQIQQTSSIQSRPLRKYHSYEHPPPPGPFSPTEEAILSAAYKHVPEHGFSLESLALGAREAGYLDISTTILPEGAFSLIRYHLVKQREALAARTEALFRVPENQKHVSISEKVELLTWERLQGNAQVIARWQEALAIMAQPSYIPSSLKELAKLADEIYFLAGDVSVDPSWYSKRASLSTTYAAAELFMTNDHSPDFRDTREFLRRRLGEASELGSAASAIREWIGFTATAGVNVLRSKGVRI